jgi:hypothetical protein
MISPGWKRREAAIAKDVVESGFCDFRAHLTPVKSLVTALHIRGRRLDSPKYSKDKYELRDDDGRSLESDNGGSFVTEIIELNDLRVDDVGKD